MALKLFAETVFPAVMLATADTLLPLIKPVAVINPPVIKLPTVALLDMLVVVAFIIPACTLEEVLIAPFAKILPVCTAPVTLNPPNIWVVPKLAVPVTVILFVCALPLIILPAILRADVFKDVAFNVVMLALFVFKLFKFDVPLTDNAPVTATVFWVITTTFCVLFTLKAMFALGAEITMLEVPFNKLPLTFPKKKLAVTAFPNVAFAPVIVPVVLIEFATMFCTVRPPAAEMFPVILMPLAFTLDTTLRFPVAFKLAATTFPSATIPITFKTLSTFAFPNVALFAMKLPAAVIFAVVDIDPVALMLPAAFILNPKTFPDALIKPAVAILFAKTLPDVLTLPVVNKLPPVTLPVVLCVPDTATPWLVTTWTLLTFPELIVTAPLAATTTLLLPFNNCVPAPIVRFVNKLPSPWKKFALAKLPKLAFCPVILPLATSWPTTDALAVVKAPPTLSAPATPKGPMFALPLTLKFPVVDKLFADMLPFALSVPDEMPPILSVPLATTFPTTVNPVLVTLTTLAVPPDPILTSPLILGIVTLLVPFTSWFNPLWLPKLMPVKNAPLPKI